MGITFTLPAEDHMPGQDVGSFSIGGGVGGGRNRAVDGVGVVPVGGGIGVERVLIASVAGVPGVADSNSSGSRCGESAGRNKGVLASDDGEGFGGIDGDEENGGGGVQERGDSSISPSESSSLRSFNSQRRLAAFLVRFAGGGEIVGEFTSVGDCDGASGGSPRGAGSVGGAGVCAKITDDGSQDVAAAFGGGGGAAKSEASVTTAFRRRRRRRQRLVAGAMVVKGRGVIEQVSETSWIPAAWRTVKLAFKPLSVQCSYRRKNPLLMVQPRVFQVVAEESSWHILHL